MKKVMRAAGFSLAIRRAKPWPWSEESGSGKSVTALSHPAPVAYPGGITPQGQAFLQGRRSLAGQGKRLRQVARPIRISMIFQAANELAKPAAQCRGGRSMKCCFWQQRGLGTKKAARARTLELA